MNVAICQMHALFELLKLVDMDKVSVGVSCRTITVWLMNTAGSKISDDL